MTHARTRSIASHPAWSRERGPAAHRLLFKTDHPRAIDRYIDFFGASAGAARLGSDPCGEGLLDSLGEEEVPA